MKRTLYIFNLVLLTLLSGCCVTRSSTTSTTDSLSARHYETQYHILRDTTIDVVIPQESISLHNIVDSVSVIETSLAISEVRLNQNGSITHSMQSKPDTLHIKATLHDTETILQDSIFTKQTADTERVIERRIIPSWVWWIVAAVAGLLLLKLL